MVIVLENDWSWNGWERFIPVTGATRKGQPQIPIATQRCPSFMGPSTCKNAVVSRHIVTSLRGYAETVLWIPDSWKATPKQRHVLEIIQIVTQIESNRWAILELGHLQKDLYPYFCIFFWIVCNYMVEIWTTMGCLAVPGARSPNSWQSDWNSSSQSSSDPERWDPREFSTFLRGPVIRPSTTKAMKQPVFHRRSHQRTQPT